VILAKLILIELINIIMYLNLYYIVHFFVFIMGKIKLYVYKHVTYTGHTFWFSCIVYLYFGCTC